MIFKFFVNLDERGDFNADVRAPDGTTVFEIHDADHLWQLMEDGFIQSKRDLDGLTDYLAGLGIIGGNDNDRLVTGN